MSEKRGAELLHSKLSASFKKRLQAHSRIALIASIYDSFTFDFWLAGTCQLLTAILQVMAPFTLRYLLKYSQAAYTARLDGTPPPAIGVGVGYALGISAMLAIQNFSIAHFYYRGMLLGGKARSSLIAMVFQKSLRLSGRARMGRAPEILTRDDGTPIRVDQRGWSDGRIMALTSSAVKRIEQGCETFHLVWTSPLQIGLTIALLIVNLGVSALAGVAILVLGLAAISYSAGFLIKSRASINVSTDQRASLTQEMLNAVRFIKYFAWEESFITRLKAIRVTETKALRYNHFLKSGLEALMMALPIFSTMLALVVYSVSGHALEPASVFSALALFNGLRTPMNWLPQSISYAADAFAALRDIENFLLAEEAPEGVTPTSGLEPAIRLDRASFTWELIQRREEHVKPLKTGFASRWLEKKPISTNSSDSQDSDPGEDISKMIEERRAFSLENISLSLGRKELIAIVGSVGSGKTSFLSALASEMRQTSGVYEFCDHRAFCAQHGWIQNASIRDNVIFGKSFDPDFYARVVRACALLPDFETLPDGDMTEIGERGITLSGGQKQRINIARAIYSQAQIVLLDDPLSAVDANVGAHIFNEAICGLLVDRCRVMATHQINTLSRCDKIIRMVDGKIVAFGTYQELLSGDATFAKQISSLGSHSITSSQRTNAETGAQNSKEESKLEVSKLMQADLKAIDSVSWAVLLAWARASGSLLNVPFMVILQSIFRGANILTSIWISWWVSNRFGLNREDYVRWFTLSFIVTVTNLPLRWASMPLSRQFKDSFSSSSRRLPWSSVPKLARFYQTRRCGRSSERRWLSSTPRRSVESCIASQQTLTPLTTRRRTVYANT